jgi:hypothetical protein
MLNCRFNSCKILYNLRNYPAVPALSCSSSTLLQFHHSPCITFPGTDSHCFIICPKSSPERRFELSISGQFNTKAVSRQQFRLTTRNVPFCDNSPVHTLHAKYYTAFRDYSPVHTVHAKYCTTFYDYSPVHRVHAKYCTTFCDYSPVHTLHAKYCTTFYDNSSVHRVHAKYCTTVCDYSPVQTHYTLNIALHFVTTARYTHSTR